MPETLLPIAFTASSSSLGRRPVMKTYAPSLANSFAVAKPIPSVPPVMRAILSLSFLGMVFLSGRVVALVKRCIEGRVFILGGPQSGVGRHVERGIIDVPIRPRCINRRPTHFVEGSANYKTFRQIGVGDERSTKRNGIS